MDHKELPRIVIVGAGFAGLSCAKSLYRAAAAITLIDQRNFHLFQPLLYQVATAALSAGDIAMPVRGILRRQGNVRVVLGRVETINRRNHAVHLQDAPHAVPYDYLVVASGARHFYFGHADWEAFAPGLKTIEDALLIRRRVLAAFEKAEVTEDINERRRLLTSVVIGGGPTGVEMAGAIAELAKAELAMRFRRLHRQQARIILVEAGPRLLTSFPESLVAKALKSLQHLGVEVLSDHKVESCDADGLIANGERIEARTLIWAAGVKASPAAQWLGVAADKTGRVPVGPDLSLSEDAAVFVIGDTAQVTGRDGKPLPGIAPPAKQEGAYVAGLLLRRLMGQPPPAPFRYRNYGNLAAIGRKSAIVDFGWIRLSGLLAWWLWGVVHIFFLIGFRNRLAVALSWLWSYITSQRSALLITSSGQEL